MALLQWYFTSIYISRETTLTAQKIAYVTH
jgi:hypothetical protein